MSFLTTNLDLERPPLRSFAVKSSEVEIVDRIHSIRRSLAGCMGARAQTKFLFQHVSTSRLCPVQSKHEHPRPWAQRGYFERHRSFKSKSGGGLRLGRLASSFLHFQVRLAHAVPFKIQDGCPSLGARLRYQSLLHLLPLYRFLQRSRMLSVLVVDSKQHPGWQTSTQVLQHRRSEGIGKGPKGWPLDFNIYIYIFILFLGLTPPAGCAVWA